jgi:hypothetical protein
VDVERAGDVLFAVRQVPALVLAGQDPAPDEKPDPGHAAVERDQGVIQIEQSQGVGGHAHA